LRGCRERREAVAAAECRKIGPVVGVRPLGSRREVGRREAVLNGSRELRQDGSPAFERLDRGQRMAAGAVSGYRVDLRAVRRRFHAHFFHREQSRLPCLRMAAFSDTISVDELHDHGGSCASMAPTLALSSAESLLRTPAVDAAT